MASSFEKRIIESCNEVDGEVFVPDGDMDIGCRVSDDKEDDFDQALKDRGVDIGMV